MKLDLAAPAPRLRVWSFQPLARHASLHTGLALLTAWALSTFGLPRLGWGALELYVAQPLVWLALLGFVVWRWRHEAPRTPFPHSAGLLVTGALLGALQVAVLVLLGLWFGFGQSLAAHSWPLVLLNLWFAGTRLAGFEFARWYFVRRLSPRRPWLGLLAAWPVFALLSLAPSLWGQLRSLGTGLAFAGRDLLPALADSLLATYLALLGGPLPALLYRGLPTVFEWVSPILPRLAWLAAAFAGTLLPLVGLVLLHDHYLPGGPAELVPAPAARPTPLAERGGSLGAWVVVALVAVGLLWFNTGLFGYRPSLISGYSMQPTFELGDLVVSRVVPLETLQVGDIVRYQLGRVDVVHRIKAITVGADGQLTFLTRGDHNNADDPLVIAPQVRGKVVLIIPKLGWPAVALRLLVSGVLGAVGGGAS